MRILIVAWAWPPIGRIGALRPLGLSREWCARGHEVHVLTGPGDRGGEHSPDLEVWASAGARVHRAPAPGLPPRAAQPSFQKSLEALVAPAPVGRLRQIAAQWASFPDQQRSWIRPAAELGLLLHARERFDVVWSTSPPESVHFVARALARAGIPWVADFRDQWSDYLLARWDPVSRWVIDALSRKVLGPARAQTGATLGVCRSLRRATGRDTMCVRNGFDPVPRVGAPLLQRHLAYFGCIDPRTQYASRLWGPLRRMKERGLPWELDIYLSSGGGGSARVIPPDDLADVVQVRPPLPHPEALKTMQRMTGLLVLAWEGRGGETQLPGKLYEYVGSERPVFVCAPRGFESRDLVEAHDVGLGAWGDEEAADALHALQTFVPNPDGRERLSRDHTAEQLLSIFERVVSQVV